MRGFSRAIYDRLDMRSVGMEFAPELIIKAAQIGAGITEIPIILWPDKRGRPPHLRSFRDGWRTLRFFLLCAPNWLFLLPGGFLFFFGLALVFWLLPGPRRLPSGVVLDRQTMMFGVVFTLIGAQVVAVGFCAKVFSYAERFDRHSVSLQRWLLRVKLEHGLIVGTLSFVAGLFGCGRVMWHWTMSGFGPLYEERYVLFWLMWLFLGVQTIFFSFLMSMLGVSRATYIGDYERRYER